ncbi:conjugation system TraG family ATPase [Arcicella aurantiaca]|uniref:Conjugation system TraG family ATPase n=1 Tax=Arcicella aurantiaca TaxID=591202 RepID=A0A316DKI5_9BACT|nr:TraG family conjugative transposon ATPase [Arcicella aurantiaca]PWK17203.1 conjugation system TraG family ATPase [Arcicella aurantiaca]
MSIRKKIKTFEDILPIFSIEDNVLIFKDGRVGVGFEVSPVEMERLMGNEYDSINQAFSNALKSLPLKTAVQKLDCYFHKKYLPQKGGLKYFEEKTVNRFYEKKILHHRSYLFLSFGRKEQVQTNAFNTLYAMGESLIKNPFEDILKTVSLAEHSTKEFINMISIYGIICKRMENECLMDFYQQYFNLDFEKNQGGFNRSFAAQSDKVCIGEKQVNIVSMIGQGSVVFNSVKSNYGVETNNVYPLGLQMDYPHILSTNILIEDREKVLSNLDMEQKLNRNLDFLMSQDNKIKMVEIDDFTEEVRSENKSLVSVNVSVIIWALSDEKREEYIQRTVAGFRQMAGAETFIETIDSANLFVANAPANSYQNYRWLLMSGDNAATYNNFITSYQSAEKGELLCDRMGNPILVNLFNTELNNQNSITIGPTGSGKSFTIGSLMIQRFEGRNRQIIIDVGGTYRSMMSALQGKYFEYDPESPIKFNPFVIDRDMDGRYNMTGDKVNFLTSLLSVIWKGTKGEITQAERSVFVKLIPMYYRYFEDKMPFSVPSIKGFYEYLKWFQSEFKDTAEYQRIARSFDFEEFFIVLEPFVYGQYQDVLNSDEFEDISANTLICFDMAKIKSNQLLYPVVAMLITELALDQIRLFPKDRKYLYMDEAWSMLSDTMGDFVETMYRTVRKNNGAMCIITQGIDEIIKSSVGSAIIANAATQIILNHTDKVQVDKLAQYLGFTQHEVDKINSIRVSTDFREIFIKQGDYARVYILEVSEAMNAVLTSKPLEREHLRTLQKRYNGNIQFAVNQYIEDKNEFIETD